MPSFLKPEARRAVLAELQKHYGGIGTALHFRDPFELLIAVMLSAQTNDNQVNKVTPALFAAYPDAAALARATPEDVKALIATIGFANTKARHAVEAAKLLVAHHGGEVPGEFDALVALPGVGRKTANVVLSNAFGVPAIPVDTHVFRVSNRLGLADSDDVVETEAHLMRHVPREDWADAHHWLIWHGRKVCKAPTPKCEECFLTAWCQYYNRTGKWKTRPKKRS